VTAHEISEQVKQKLLARLRVHAGRHAELARMIADPELMKDSARYQEVAKEHGALAKLAEAYRELQRVCQEHEEAHEILSNASGDAEMRALAQEEITRAEQTERQLLQEALDQLLSDTAEPDRNVIVEIRSGTGGEEAALFAADLFRMYARYAQKRGWQTEILDKSVTDMGGFRQIAFSISGPGVWQKMRYESGGHRVQRVPVTESQGRIHTSLATVAVLSEPEELDVQIKPEDLEIEFMRSQGPGGQNVNKVNSCVRIVHKPTGISVKCQEQPSQHKNRKLALKLLRAKLYEQQARHYKQKRNQLRRSQVGSGDRSERIRTYNFPQDRITDHRTGLDVFGIQNVLMGDCDPLLDMLADWDRQQRIEELLRES